MKRYMLIAGLLSLFTTTVVEGRGLLIPVEPDLPPLAMLNHHVSVTLEDQVAITKVEQTFRNHTDRPLEATYVFPVPSGASVRDFAMWVDGRRVKGELLQAEKAKQIYTSIVRQTKNPALLDYIGSDLLSLKIFPVPPNGDQKVELSFTAVATREHDLVEYVYPLKTDRASATTMEEFRLSLTLKSQQPIGSIYSPSHEIVINQANDHEATVLFERQSSRLDRDFQLFYSSSGQDVGLTTLQQRPIADEDGYVMLLLSPRAELSKDQKVPRDIVFVVDTSGSMLADKKIEQARKALKYCLSGLAADDRFALVSFATTVDRYRDHLVPASEQHIKRAQGWVSDLYAGGGTAIHEALTTALEMRSDDAERMFTVVFFTDGQPTIGETDVDKILAAVEQRNTGNTRIFSFGLGNDLNAAFLDQIAERSRAISSYVRPQQDIEAKVSSFFNKIHHPVLANLQLSTTGDVRLMEVYPPQLPDLFHGDQLVVLARCHGAGPTAIILDGKVGIHDKQFAYQVAFAEQTDDKSFVEELWARRKVGYLLDQIRINGEQQELVDEVIRLAKGYGITTPYTSYLIMPDAPVQLAANQPAGTDGSLSRYAPPALAAEPSDENSASTPKKVSDFARQIQQHGDFGKSRNEFQEQEFDKLGESSASASGDAAPGPDGGMQERLRQAKDLKYSLDRAYDNYRRGDWRRNQIEKLGVDLALNTKSLKNQTQLEATAVRRVARRNCMEIGGVWIDEAFTATTRTLAVKAQSDAYFRILQRQPQMKDVFQLGNHVVWITPSGTALIVDTNDGVEQLGDREIDRLFVDK